MGRGRLETEPGIETLPVVAGDGHTGPVRLMQIPEALFNLAFLLNFVDLISLVYSSQLLCEGSTVF